MRFGAVPVDEALGGIVAHTLRNGDLVLRKGTIVTTAHVEQLRAASVAKIMVAFVDDGDLGEDEAALRLARSLAGPGTEIELPFTGRSNLFSQDSGLLVVDTAAIIKLLFKLLGLRLLLSFFSRLLILH